MDKQQKEKKIVDLTAEMTSRVNMLQTQIDNLTIEYNAEVKKRRDEIDTLSLQSEALISLKIK